MRELLPVVIAGILSASGVTAVVQAFLLPRTSAKVRADTDAVIAGSAKGVVAMVHAELEESRARARHSDMILGEALGIVRQLLDVVRRSNINGPHRAEITELEVQARELEIRRHAS
jgi:hypothetical protein